MNIDYDSLYYSVDNFCKSFEPWYRKKLVSNNTVKWRNRDGKLKLSEILTILIAYHQSGYSCFKYFYFELCRRYKSLFADLVHYSRFITLIKRGFPALIYLMQSLTSQVTEYLFIDSTPITVCHNRRESRNRVFKGMAAKGKTSTGFFFGFKLHMLINCNGEIVRLFITPGNVDDRAPVRQMLSNIQAKLIGDKGYISQSLFDDLLASGVKLITRLKKNMKNKLMELEDKIMLMKRFFIETVFSSMKSLNTLVHHRHRCPINAFAHLLSGIISYQLRPDKPSLSSLIKLYP